MIKFQKLSYWAKSPKRATDGAIGYDLYTIETVRLLPNNHPAKIHTGIAISSPWGAIIKDRSSLASKGLAVMGGVIDADYRGEIIVIMQNRGDEMHEFQFGDKIAQLVIPLMWIGDFVESELLDETARSDGGFGSTGK